MKLKQLSKLVNRSVITTVITSAIIFPAIAHANEFDNVRQKLAVYTLDAPHWYASGNIGVSQLHDVKSPGTPDSVNNYGPGWNVNGGYQFNSLLGAELGYTQYHDSRETLGGFNIAKTEHYTTDMAAVGRYPLGCQFSALGKLGLAYSYVNKIFNASGFAKSAGSLSVYWGLGLAYSITQKIDFDVQYAAAAGNHLTGTTGLLSLGLAVALV